MQHSLADFCDQWGIEVEEKGETLTLETSDMSAEIHATLLPNAPQALGEFVAGCAHALRLFRDKRPFAEVAGKVIGRLVSGHFLDGVSAVKGAEPMKGEWPGALSICYWMSGEGREDYLAKEDFERWGISLDHLHCTARSNLYHRTNACVQALDGGLMLIDLDDASGAALALADIEWSAKKLIVALPHRTTLLYQPHQGELGPFKKKLAQISKEKGGPLQPEIWLMEKGKPSLLA